MSIHVHWNLFTRRFLKRKTYHPIDYQRWWLMKMISNSINYCQQWCNFRNIDPRSSPVISFMRSKTEMIRFPMSSGFLLTVIFDRIFRRLHDTLFFYFPRILPIPRHVFMSTISRSSHPPSETCVSHHICFSNNYLSYWHESQLYEELLDSVWKLSIW